MIAPIPDVKRIVMAWARETFPLQLAIGATLRVRLEVPDGGDLRPLLVDGGIFLRVGAIPGQTDLHQVSQGIDFDVFAARDDDASEFARKLDAAFLRGRHRIASGASLDSVGSRLSPEAVPWADAGVRRYYSSYSVTARR